MVSRVVTLVAFSLVQQGVSSSQFVRAEVKHVLATPYHIEDSDVAAYKVTFDLRLANQSTDTAVNFPKVATSDERVARFTLLGLQAKQPDGTWKSLFQASWYGDRSTRYESCMPLAPGKEAEFSKLSSTFVLLKRQLTELGTDPILRFGLMFFCDQPDGAGITTRVTTEGFSLRLPDLHR